MFKKIKDKLDIIRRRTIVKEQTFETNEFNTSFNKQNKETMLGITLSETMEQVNQYVIVKDKGQIYTSGNYTVGEQFESGEYYFWGEMIWYTRIGKKEKNYYEYRCEAYDVLENGDKLSVIKGSFTHIDNVEFTWTEEELLIPGHIYRLGVEVPRGRYLFKYDKEYTNFDDSYQDELTCRIEVYDDYTSGRCAVIYGGCSSALLEQDMGYIKIINGAASFCGDVQFNEQEIVDNCFIDENKFFSNGFSVFKSKIFDIRLYMKYFNGGRFECEFPIYVLNYYIYSLGDKLKWRADIYPVDSLPPKSMTVLVSSLNNMNKCVIQIDDFTYHYDRDKFLKYYRISTELPSMFIGCEIKLQMIEYNGYIVSGHLLDGKNPYCIGYDNIEKYKEQFELLSELLVNFEGIDIENEVKAFEKYPYYLNWVNTCLLEVLDNEKKFKNKFGIENEIISFTIDATYSKQYYCAAKLADSAIEVTKSADGEKYTISFKGTQISEIEMMSYMFYSVADEQQCSVRRYLNEHSYLYNSIDKIQNIISEINKSYAYSTFLSNSVLVNVIKILNERIKNRIDEIYSDIAREGRIVSRWGNEYHLFVLISKFVKNSQYQYRCSWLGQQSFDIFLPEKSIAIEYQGKQHYEAVEIFGGQEGYKKTKERDEKKKKLAKEHNVVLLEWNYAVSVNEDNVKSFLKENNIAIDMSDLENQIDAFKESINMAPVKKKEYTKKKERTKIERKIKEYIIKYSLEGHFIEKYSTLLEAAADASISSTSIAKVIKGDRNSAGGYVWRKCGVDEDILTTIDISFDISLTNSGQARKVAKIDKNGNVIKEYPSVMKAANENGISPKNIQAKIKKEEGWKYIG